MLFCETKALARRPVELEDSVLSDGLACCPTQKNLPPVYAAGDQAKSSDLHILLAFLRAFLKGILPHEIDRSNTEKASALNSVALGSHVEQFRAMPPCSFVRLQDKVQHGASKPY